MWNNNPSAGSAPSYYGHQPPNTSQPPPSLLPGAPSATTNNPTSSSSSQKHDIFVGNLAFSTTEEQLYSAFSELGRIIKIRMVSDLETGKPRGFAFIEFEDPQAALSAIRNMNEYEINGRRIRVNFSNSSHLETLANQLGMDLSHVTGKNKGGGGDGDKSSHQHGSSAGGAGAGGGGSSTGMGGSVAGTKMVASALKNMSKSEMYDVLSKLKELADTNPDEARKLLTQHPQLPEAILYCMSELDMIRTPVSGVGIAPGGMPDMSVPPPSVKPADPRAAASDPRARGPPPPMTQPPPSMPPPPPAAMGMPSDPRARPADPRAARDPRAAAAAGGAPNFPPPPMMQPPPSGLPPPPMTQPPPPMTQPPPPGVPPPAGGVAGLDPNLVQQVMALTPQQIAQLPPDKQASILALRSQITGGRR